MVLLMLWPTSEGMQNLAVAGKREKQVAMDKQPLWEACLLAEEP